MDVVVHQTARFFQKTTTQYNPYFAFFKNIAIDIPSSYMFSETGYKPIASQLARYGKDAVSSEARSIDAKYVSEYERLG